MCNGHSQGTETIAVASTVQLVCMTHRWIPQLLATCAPPPPPPPASHHDITTVKHARVQSLSESVTIHGSAEQYGSQGSPTHIRSRCYWRPLKRHRRRGAPACPGPWPQRWSPCCRHSAAAVVRPWLHVKLADVCTSSAPIAIAASQQVPGQVQLSGALLQRKLSQTCAVELA